MSEVRGDGLGFRRTASLRISGVQIPGGVRVRGHRLYGALACALILLLAPVGLRGQIANSPVENTTPTPPVPKAQETAPAQGERTAGYGETQTLSSKSKEGAESRAATESLRALEGLQIEAVEFEGVIRERLEPLPEMLALQPHQTLRTEDVRESLRRLYATGLYKGISEEGVRHGNAVTILFNGTPQMFLGRVTVDGMKNDRLANQLQRSTRLTAGTRYDEAKVTRAANLLTETLQENGYYLGSFDKTVTEDSADAQVDLHYQVTLGKQARVGAVEGEGATPHDAGCVPQEGEIEGEFQGDARHGEPGVERSAEELREKPAAGSECGARVEAFSGSGEPAEF